MKTFYRYFLPHQYEKEAAFLTSMSKKGWKFIKIQLGIPARYIFKKTDEEPVFYQMDYLKQNEDNSDYHQLFLDAGWKEVYSLDGLYGGKWYYYCKPLTNNEPDFIYTDTDSKIAMYTKLLKHWGLFTLCVIFSVINGFTLSLQGIVKEIPFSGDWFFRLAMILLFGTVSVVYFYMIGGLITKIIKLHILKKNKKSI